MSLVTIADKGDTLETLKALRHKLAKAIEESKSGRDISSLARQLQIVMAQISDLEEKNTGPNETALAMIRRKHGKLGDNKVIENIKQDPEDTEEYD